MYKLIYSCGYKTTLRTVERKFAFECAKVMYMHRTGTHYELKLYHNNRLIVDWSCLCYRGLGTKLPDFKS